MSDLVGALGYVTIAIRGPDRPGEVSISPRGSYIAWSRDPLPAGVQIIVTAVRDTRTVSVQPTGL